MRLKDGNKCTVAEGDPIQDANKVVRQDSTVVCLSPSELLTEQPESFENAKKKNNRRSGNHNDNVAAKSPPPTSDTPSKCEVDFSTFV